MLHRRDGIGQVMSGVWFLPDMVLGIQAKELNLRFIRPENLMVWGAFWQTPSGLSCAFY